MGRDLVSKRLKRVKVIRRYSEALKREVVLECESGRSSVAELVKQYGIGNTRTVYRWCKKYGQYQTTTKIVRVIMKSEKELIKELKETVADLTLRNRVYEVTLALLEKDESIKKKLSTEQLKKLESLKAQIADLRSKSSVDVSE